MTQREPAVAVVGCGYWGKNLVRNFSMIGQLRLVCDPFPAVAASMSEQFSVPHASFEDILADEGVRGVAIAAPAAQHAGLAARCLRAGKHVFVEKPVALVVEDAKALIKLAGEQQRLLMVGHLLNYHPGFLKVCELAASGMTGSLRRIYSNRLSFGKVRTEENVLWSFAPHDISMILRLAGGQRPVTVSAHGAGYVSEGIDDFAVINMGFEGGLTAHVFVSWLHPFKEQRLVVIGERASVVFDDTAAADKKVGLYRNSAAIVDGQPVLQKEDVEYIQFDESEPLRNECLAFLAGMDAPSGIYTDGAEGLRVLEVLGAAEDAMTRSRQGA
jgi:UDP-2-acetamido-3-amino-2,3-dideoxy-glucuronate N-acetyltransferase